MKIEVNLSEIFHDEEYGSETMQESIKRQVVSKLSEFSQDKIGKMINSEISKTITESIKEKASNEMEKLVIHALNSEYCEVDRWGNTTGKKTTLRNEIVKNLNEQMIYTKANSTSSYNDNRNVFSKSVDSCVSELVKSFEEHFKQTIDKEFKENALRFAISKLQEKLGIK